MPIRPDQLDAALRTPARAWIVAGEEPLLVEESADRVRGALRAEGFAEREQIPGEGKGDWDALYATLSAPSLFASRRIVEMRCEGLDGRGAAALTAAAEHAGEDAALLVVTGAFDSRTRKTKWFGELDRGFALVYAWRVASEELPRWIEQRLQARGLRASREAVAAIVACSEGHLLAAAQLIEQLRALQGREPAPLDADAVWALGADMARFDPFSLMDRVFAGDGAGAVRAARSLRRGGTELPAITGGLAFVLRQWHEAQSAFARSGDARAATRSAKVFGPRARALERALGRSRAGHVQGLIRWLAEIDSAAKRGQAAAAWDDLLTWCSVASGAISPGFLPRSLCKT